MNVKRRKATSEETRILEMLAAKRISAEEADELLSALRRPNQFFAWLYNPHAKLNTAGSMTAALLAALVGMSLSRAGVVFDGVLDFHLVPKIHSWSLVIFEMFVAWPLFAVCMKIIAKLLSVEGRIVDFLAMIGVARVPLVLGGVLFAILMSSFASDFDLARQISVNLVLALCIVIPAWILFVMWLWQGFAWASGRRDKRAVAAFVTSIVISEIASKLLLEIVA